MTDYDASNPKHIVIARKSAKAVDESRASFINHIMGMVDGRAYIHNLLSNCLVLVTKDSFVNAYTGDALSTAFSCGRQYIGQQLLAEIMQYCPDDYIKMMREANARSTADDVRRSRSNEDSNRNDSGPEYVHPAFDPGAAERSAEARIETEYDPTEDGGEV